MQTENFTDDWFLAIKDFDGYEEHARKDEAGLNIKGSGFRRCSMMANRWMGKFVISGELPEEPLVLRTCLFFEWRRYKHFGENMDSESFDYINKLLRKYRNFEPCKPITG